MNLRFLAAPLLLIVIAACSAKVDTGVTLTQVYDALQGTPSTSPAILWVPQPSKEACEQNLPSLTTKFAALGPVDGDITCSLLEDSNYARIATLMTVYDENDPPDVNSLFFIAVRLALDPETLKPSEPPTANLMFGATMPINDIVTALAASTEEQQVVLETTEFTVLFGNDTANRHPVLIENIYRDGRPVADMAQPLTLPSGQTWELVLSNVASDFVSFGGTYLLASVPLETE